MLHIIQRNIANGAAFFQGVEDIFFQNRAIVERANLLVVRLYLRVYSGGAFFFGFAFGFALRSADSLSSRLRRFCVRRTLCHCIQPFDS